MARPRQQQSVQLFPFLAVLVCVMGALIFLLLVTTRNLRAAAVAKARAAQQSLADEQPIDVELAEDPELPPSLLPSAVEWRPVQSAFGSDTDTQQKDLDQVWRQRLSQLSTDYEARKEALARQRLLAAAAQKRITELQQELKRLETEYGHLTGELSANQLQPTSGDRERVELERQITALRQRLKALHDQQQSTDGRFSVVPFDGKSGTTRRPILIECTATGLRFVAEDITLKPSDIEGFTERYNPLLAGSVALVSYWNQWNADHAQDDASSDPYVLLLVRPSGTLAYYIAMRLLSPLKQPHGYELISEDLPLAVPPADAGAKAACEAAIQRMLAERQQVFDSVRGRRGASPATNATPAARGGAASSKAEFEMADLDAAANEVGSRSWETPERFEGQEFRRTRPVGGAESPSAGARPDPLPRDSEAQPRPAGPPISAGASSTPPTGKQTEPALLPERLNEEGRYPSFAKSKRSSAQTRDLPYEQLQRRKWGPHDPGASIGVEKTVVIHVDAQKLVVDGNVAIPVPLGAPRNQVFDRLLMVIDQSAQTWGKPGSGFFWIPSLKFVISPGGNQIYERIAPLVSKCGLSSSTEFTLERPPTTTPGGQP